MKKPNELDLVLHERKTKYLSQIKTFSANFGIFQTTTTNTRRF